MLALKNLFVAFLSMEFENFFGLYTLTHFNGKKTPASATLCLTKDGESILVSAHVANSIKGKARLDSDRLIGMLLSSMISGDQSQMMIEGAIIGGFASGFEVQRDLHRLLLRNESNTLIFAETVTSEDAVGNYSIVSVNGDIPPTPFFIEIILADDTINLHANLGVLLEGQAQLIDGVLEGVLCCQNAEDEENLTSLAKLVVKGFRRGFQVRKNETGLLLAFNDCLVQLCCVIGKNEIQGEYIFKSMNGSPISSSRQLLLTLSAKDEILFSASIASNLECIASLDGNTIFSDGPMRSTEGTGNEDVMKVEGALTEGMQKGFSLAMVGNQLTMKGPTSFVLLKVAKVPATLNGPTFKGTYVVKCFSTEKNGLLFRIIDEVSNTWAFYNDTPDYKMKVNATLGSRSVIEVLGKTACSKDETDRYVADLVINPGKTELFIRGKVNGFKFLYSAVPVKKKE